MGPEGGAGGGLVIAEGTPEQVAAVGASHTGKFLREILDADRISDGAPVKAPRKVAAKKTAAVAAKKSVPAKKATPAKKTTRARKA
jgi:excinuclease ABC subunit A